MIFIFFYSITSKNFIAVYNADGYFLCETKDDINDILESGNIILTFGKNFIEIFNFSRNNNNDNNNNKPKLEKKLEISINNNNINNDNQFNNNDNNNNEITTIQLYQNLIICGHRSGFLSIWNPVNNNNFLQKKGEIQTTKSVINKIYYEKIPNEKDYLFICCADGIVQKFSFEESKAVLISQKYEAEIVDIKLVNDYDKKNILIISLKNGSLKMLDLNLNFLFDIPSRFKYTNVRYVIGLQNPETIKDNTKGDLLLITEGNLIDVYTWIKPGFIKNNNNKEQNPNNDINMQYQSNEDNNNFGQRFQFKGFQ